jgi:glucose-1-phosphatase
MLKNLIFDLGDVIIPIDMGAPIRNFAQLAGLPEADVKALFLEHNLWFHYETGVVDDEGFRQGVRQLLRQHHSETSARPTTEEWTDEIIDFTWNTILLDLPVERVERLEQLKASGNYRLFLLSNTSAIHIRQVNQMLAALNKPILQDLFERVFLSYEVQLAKPSPEIYQHVLQEAGIVAEETAFFDDNAANIAAAAALGIQAVHVVAPKTILDYTVDL